MKYIITILICFSFIGAKAQYPIATFKDTISIDLPNDTIAGIPLKRKATYRVLTDLRDLERLSVTGVITYYSLSGSLFSLIAPKPFELLATNEGYVTAGNSAYIGDIAEVKRIYGNYDSTGQTWSYSRPDIMGEYDFYIYVSTQPYSMHNLIFAALDKSEKLKAKQ